jgi:hypothetical protein
MALRAEGIAVFEQAVLRAGLRQHQWPSSPAKAGDPVRRGSSIQSLLSLEYWADSTGRRNTSCMAHSEKLVESFRWCFPAEGFPGPGVEC